MYFMTSPATAMTMALEMMDEAAREAHGRRGNPAVRTRRAARRTATEQVGRPARRGWRLARVFRLAH